MISPEMLDGVPEEQKALLAAGMSQMDPSVMMQIMADGQRAAELRASGDEAGARAIIENYRALADQYGLGDLFSTLFDGE